MTSTTAVRGDDRPLLHGRRPLAGLAHRAPLLRPAPRTRHERGLSVATPTARPRPRPALGLGRGRDRLAQRGRATTPSTWSTSAPPATPTPRSRSPPSRPASTSCARSRWPTPSPRPRRWWRPPSRRRAHGVRAMVGFTYRRVPGDRAGPAAGAGGPDRRGPPRPRAVPPGLDRRPRGARCRGAWRRSKAGSGALGDIAAHIIDLAQFITGDRIREVSGRLETFVKERPLATEHAGLSGVASTERGPVTVDDAASFLAQLHRRRDGRLRGHPLRHRTQERDPARDQRLAREPGVRLRGHERPASTTTPPSRRYVAGFRRILVTEPEHPYVAAWWPAGHGLGYEHGFTHQVVDLVRAIADETDPTPTFADGLQVQRVLAAVEASSDTRQWQEIP